MPREASKAVRGTNQSGGQVNSASFGISEHKRAVLQSEDIMAVGEGRQLIRTNGPHLYVADRVPWFQVARWSGKLGDVRQLAREPLATSTDPHLPSIINETISVRRLPALLKALPAPPRRGTSA